MRHQHQSDLRGVAQVALYRKLCDDEASAMYKTVQDRHSWVVRFSQRGRKCLDDSHTEILGNWQPSIVQIQQPFDQRAVHDASGNFVLHREKSTDFRWSHFAESLQRCACWQPVESKVELCLAQTIEECSPLFADSRNPRNCAHGQLESSNVRGRLASTSACKCYPTHFADCVLLPLLPKCTENHTDTRRRTHSAHTRQARWPEEHKHTRQARGPEEHHHT